jgi:hypothetical protein
MEKQKQQQGSMILYLIISISIFSILMLPILDNIIFKISALRTSIDREQALQIAEAGVNYYQWHLAHFPEDYQGGSGVHDYIDADTQENVGQFDLVITPPLVGSTIVTIQSTGWTNNNPNITRTITVQYGKPSLAKYAFLSHWHIWIYPSDAISGQFMANNGVRFEGTGNASIQSAKETYLCTHPDGCEPDQEKPGIWAPEAYMPPQSTLNFWEFPVPAVDFSSLTSTLSDMKELAQENGGTFYLPPTKKEGYHVVFNSDSTVTIRRVIKRQKEATGYAYVYDDWTPHSSTDYDNNNTLPIFANISLPSNGIIFAEDNLWVEGTVNGRITVAAAILGETDMTKMPSIYIPNNILYQSKDGSNVLGLIAQRDIVYSLYSPTDLEIDAAQIAQNGAIKVLYYSGGGSCQAGQSCPGNYPYIKNSVTTYGSIMSYDGWVWSWSDASGLIFSGGYMHTYNNYDYNLLYAPPPSFPFSTSDYQQLNWRSN